MNGTYSSRWIMVAAAICATAALRLIGTTDAADRSRHNTRLAPVAAEVETETETVYTVISSHPQPMLANVSDDYQVVRLWPRSDALATAREALDQQCEAAEFAETPFRDVVATVADKAGVRISLDHKALENTGFDINTPINADLAGLSFRAGLRKVLEDIDLAYVLRNDHVVITTADTASSTMDTVFYPVLAGVNVDEVAVLLEATVFPESWSHVGGAGTIIAAPAGLGHGLVVSHNSDAHEQIEAVLRNLDGALWVQEQTDEDKKPVFVRVYAVDDDDTRTGLQERLLTLCNDSLPHGADADARIEVIGKSLVVQSSSRPFQVMAAHIIAAVVGEELELEIESDEATPASVSDGDT